MRKPDAAAVLAGKMIETLERLRGQNGDAHPPTLAVQAAQADAAAPPELAAKALIKKPFAARLLAARNHPESPVVLAEDAGRLVDAPRLIEFALSLLCTPEKRLHAPSKLVGKVDKALKPAFAAALQRRIADGSLPAAVGVTEVRGKPQLYLQSLAPPALTLARALMAALRERKKQGGDAYPARPGDLTDAPPERLREAVAEPVFKTGTIRALANDPDGPTALADDARLLADSPRTLEAALTAVRTPDHQAVPLTDLKKKVAKSLQAAFEAAVIARVAAGAPLGPAVGRLYVRKKPHFFLLQDVNAASRERQRPEEVQRETRMLTLTPARPSPPISPLPSTRRSNASTVSAGRTTSSASSISGRPFPPTAPPSTPACSSSAAPAVTPSAPPRADTASTRKNAPPASSRAAPCCSSCQKRTLPDRMSIAP